MQPTANRLLWVFIDAVTPTKWRSKQAQRVYEAAIAQERSGASVGHCVSGSVKIATHKSDVPAMREPSFGYRMPDVCITSAVQRHVNALRKHADHLEAVMSTYGPDAFRTKRIAVEAPKHPLSAEEAISSVISRNDVDELWVHGVHFVRDSSRAFVRAAATTER